MKKIMAAIAVLSILTGTMMSGQAVTQSGEKERGTISISTSAEAEVAPDVADLSFAVVTTDNKSMQKATLMNKDISDSKR